MRRTLLLALLPVLACATVRHTPEVAQPMAGVASAYEVAGQLPLPEVAPEETGGLHNVYHLSENVVSGAEPASAESLQTLHDMGIRTILSVDGKAPDVAGAEALGMRYVHVPIQYSGITEDELLKISKTFRELEGPFYVHCYHGKHRGPAAAAVGRLVLDGVPREEALAEMRQWCGTSGAYEGLYLTIASGAIPDARQSHAFDWGFDSVRELHGIPGAMVELARSFDGLTDLSKSDWAPAPNHPDLTAEKELPRIRMLFERSLEADDARNADPDYRALMEDALRAADQLEADVLAWRNGAAVSPEAAGKALKGLKASCTACHERYRN